MDCQEIKITQKQYKPSFYNLIVSHGSWTLLFNGVTSGLMRLPKELADQLIPFLGDIRNRSAGSGLKEWNCQPYFAKLRSNSRLDKGTNRHTRP